MENGPFIDDFPIKPPIYKGFSMAMLNNQMVYINLYNGDMLGISWVWRYNRGVFFRLCNGNRLGVSCGYNRDIVGI